MSSFFFVGSGLNLSLMSVCSKNIAFVFKKKKKSLKKIHLVSEQFKMQIVSWRLQQWIHENYEPLTFTQRKHKFFTYAIVTLLQWSLIYYFTKTVQFIVAIRQLSFYVFFLLAYFTFFSLFYFSYFFFNFSTKHQCFV